MTQRKLLTMISEDNSQAMLNRLSRIEGQLRGIQKMINVEDADCEKVLQQMAASRKALDKAAHVMLACMIEHSAAGEGKLKSEDLSALISKYA
jgi:DNA-binding FrmR family transcriptional regulator